MTTKSVLSQSANMQSGSALALGSLMNKKSAKPREGSAKREGSAGSAEEGASEPPQNPAPRPAPSGNAKPRQDATKSVLSASSGMQSGSAMALAGALNQQSSKRGGNAPPTGTTPAAPAPSGANAQQRGNATKSVLSAATGMKSGSAMALAGAFNQPSKRSPPTGTAPAAPAPSGASAASPERTAPIQATSPSEPSPGPDELGLSAGQPTRAEEQKRIGGAVADPTAPLLHPDDWQQGYMNRQPQEIRVEHDGGSKKGSWGCCTSSVASQAEVISKPKNAAVHSRHLLIQPPKPPGPAPSGTRQTLEKILVGLNLQCATCSKEIVQEIIDI